MKFTTKTLTFFFFLIMFSSLILAAPPQSGQFLETGLDIRFIEHTHLKFNTTYEFSFHVYNTTNGVPIVNGIVCYFHLFNSTLGHAVTMTDATVSPPFDYSFLVDKGNFTVQGDYSYLIQCNDSSVGGFSTDLLIFNGNGEKQDQFTGTLIIGVLLSLTLVILGAGFLFAYLYSNTDPINKWLKILFLISSLLSITVAVGLQNKFIQSNTILLGTVFDGASGGTLSLVLWVLRISLIALSLYVLYAVTMAFLGKKVGGPESG